MYVDDILIFAKTLQEHQEYLRSVFERLRRYKAHLKAKKCEFLKSSITYLGHVFDAEGCHTDPAKVRSIVLYRKPTTVAELRGFLALQDTIGGS